MPASEETLFLALLPDRETADSIERRSRLTRRKHGFRGHLISAERLHVSLYYIGPYSSWLVEEVSRIAETVRFAPFDITLDRALTYKNRNPHPFVLTRREGLETVRAFYRELGGALNRNGFDLKIARAFEPHPTLIWDENVVPEYLIERPITWTVREFVLIRSFVGHSRYEFVGRWLLSA